MTEKKENKSLISKCKGYLVGTSYAFLWFGSILLGFYFLYAPCLLILPFSRRLYRKITDTLYSSWEAFNVSLLQTFYGVKIVLTGDNFISENALIVINHPTRTDWNFLWAGLHHGGPNHNAKIILKEELKKVPGLGWIMAMTRFVFLKRSWAEDCKTLDQMLEYFSGLKEESPKQLILFPEGTNLSESARKRSDAFAVRNNRQVYTRVLHPRTTGFVHLTKGMMERNFLDAVYDVTIAYPDTKPMSEQSILQGDFPSQVNLHFVRHPLTSLPNTYIGLEKWLEERWRDKETALNQFYSDPAFIFPHLSPSQLCPRPLTLLQPLCLVFCLLLFTKFLYLSLTSWLALAWIVLISGLVVLLETRLGGLQQLEMRWDTGNTQAPLQLDEEFEHVKND